MTPASSQCLYSVLGGRKIEALQLFFIDIPIQEYIPKAWTMTLKKNLSWKICSEDTMKIMYSI